MDKINKKYKWIIYILALFGLAAIACLVSFMLGGEFNINKYFRYLWICGVAFLSGVLIDYRRNKRKKQQ
ncbi:MAG: hypothetical protein LBK58_06775 [Prevotellaceae bacterium]|jgi:hypothetical protein|nr:hypothetical protein [Prevotellaceae bacterium]